MTDKKQENYQKLLSYWDVQDSYYSYLKEKLGHLFVGNYNEANGKILKNNGDFEYHLSTIERRCKLRQITFKVCKGNEIKVKLRSGCSEMIAIINDDIFPKMRIISYENNEQYGRKSIGEITNIWNCNEIIAILS